MLKSKAKWHFLNQQVSNSLTVKNNQRIKSEITLNLLKQRGITTIEETTRFISPNLDHLYNPQDLSMIDKASKRIHKAIAEGEKILIFGDYDADGICSTALLLKTLYELNAICDYYIPNRFTEGYGLNKQVLKKYHDKGYTVIITVDTGIASLEEADFATKLGIDLIITDHHDIQEQLPSSYAIINPKCSPDYSFHDLAGVGVAFKFAQFLLGYFPKHLMDLVAIGTIADLVPLIDENRILAYYGLRELAQTKNLGLKALKDVCEIDADVVTEEDVAFSLGPRMNAVGRIRDANIAVQLLMSTESTEAIHVAEKIDAINKERQQIVHSIFKEAEQMVKTDQQDGMIILAKKGWNEGVLGIVASRLVQEYDRPAIVLTMDQDQTQFKGSARSIPTFNIFEKCMEIRDLFTHFGGHSQAAGMTIPFENLELIKDKLNSMIMDELTDEDFKQVIEINHSLNISELNEELINEINLLGPFGMGNPKPIFHLKAIPTTITQIGHLKNHLKVQFSDGNLKVEGIGFGMGDLFHHISPQTEISLVGDLGVNEWNGIKTPQIMMKDLEIEVWQMFDHRGKRNVDLSIYMMPGERKLIVSNQNHNLSEKNIEHITYESDINTLTEVDTLYIFDLPPNVEKLKAIISVTKPIKIHVCFYLENSIFLKPFPSREDFKWLYALVFQRQSLNVQKNIPHMMDAKGWTKENIIFMLEVFIELGFMNGNHQKVQINKNPVKKDLQQSLIYRERLNQSKIEQILYYSNYKTLRDWFSNCMNNVDTAEEEVAHGL